MKRFLLASTISVGLTLLPHIVEAKTLPVEDQSIAIIPITHEFTVTFSDAVTPNKQLIKDIDILQQNKEIPMTESIQQRTVHLKPASNLQLNTSYAVDITLKDGTNYNRQFYTATAEQIALLQPAENALTSFLTNNPSLAHTPILQHLQTTIDELKEVIVNDQTIDATLQAQAQSIPAQLTKLTEIIKSTNALKKAATAASANIADKTLESEMTTQLDDFQTMLQQHLEQADSIAALEALQSPWQNALQLLQATASEGKFSGLVMMDTLKYANDAIINFILQTPYPAQASEAAVVKVLQSSFSSNINYISEEESKYAIRLKPIEDKTSAVEEFNDNLPFAQQANEEINALATQYRHWQDHKAISGVAAQYAVFAAQLNVIKSAITGSSASTLEAATMTAPEKAYIAAQKIEDLITTYLQKELTKFDSRRDTLMANADKKGINLYDTEQLSALDNALTDANNDIGFYSDTLTWTQITTMLDEVNKRFAATEALLK